MISWPSGRNAAAGRAASAAASTIVPAIARAHLRDPALVDDIAPERAHAADRAQRRRPLIVRTAAGEHVLRRRTTGGAAGDLRGEPLQDRHLDGLHQVVAEP